MRCSAARAANGSTARAVGCCSKVAVAFCCCCCCRCCCCRPFLFHGSTIGQGSKALEKVARKQQTSTNHGKLTSSMLLFAAQGFFIAMTGQKPNAKRKRASGNGVATLAPQQSRLAFGDSANDGSLSDGASPGTTGLSLADTVRSESPVTPSHPDTDWKQSPSHPANPLTPHHAEAVANRLPMTPHHAAEAVANVSKDDGVPPSAEESALLDAAPVENYGQAAAALVQFCDEVCGPVADGALGGGPTVPLAEVSVDLPDPDDREAGEWKRASRVIKNMVT